MDMVVDQTSILVDGLVAFAKRIGAPEFPQELLQKKMRSSESNRLDINSLKNGSIPNICRDLALDYCCLNYELPPICRNDDIPSGQRVMCEWIPSEAPPMYLRAEKELVKDLPPKQIKYFLSFNNPPLLFERQQHQNCQYQWYSSWQGHGTDLLIDSLAHNDGVPKIILNGHSETGFDVVNMVKNKDPSDETLRSTGGIVHCTGSILVFPGACYLWHVRTPNDLTVESLAPALLYRPALEYLFVGSSQPIPPSVVQAIRVGLNDQASKMRNGTANHIVVEPMDLTNAMGTFNILNGEDRRVGAALILPLTQEETAEHGL
ncbi:DUF498/DUF598 domain containing protein [Nitzschia inconspicua]|uniref:DUF498/DUF598 domain containing protein n=1 Tax=Nitzschia inconspicua TaxID=303405 RepID=A0A9K3LTE0_9STRA|nr:DUF498/DUF598 domain containing protein [Nitzschia inconspicua]